MEMPRLIEGFAYEEKNKPYPLLSARTQHEAKGADVHPIRGDYCNRLQPCADRRRAIKDAHGHGRLEFGAHFKDPRSPVSSSSG
jgi:hypothetical protein